MNATQHLLFDGSPFARPCDGQRNIATAPVPVIPGSDAALSLAFLAAATFRRIPVTEIASGVSAWRFCVADGLDRAKPMLYATDAVAPDIAADTLDIDLAEAWTEQMRDAIGDRPKAVFIAELAGYASAEDAGAATSPVFSVTFPFCAANRRDDGAETTPLRDLSIEAHNASETAHPAIRDALDAKATKADATLTETEHIFSDWSFSNLPQGVTLSLQWNQSEELWFVDVEEGPDSDGWSYPFDGVGQSADDTTLTIGLLHYDAGSSIQTVNSVEATRSRIPTAYRLGPDAASNPNRDKPLAPAGDYALKSEIPAVVAPSTDAADAGKAADAKATGDALAEKLDKSGGTMTGNLTISNARLRLSDGNGVVRAQFADDGAMFDTEVFGYPHSRIPNRFAAIDDIPAVSAETWTFEIDDGQGGTTTVTKSVAVFAAQNAQNAQGGTP